MKLDSEKNEIVSTIQGVFSKYLNNFRLEMSEVYSGSIPIWRFSFSFHCLIDGHDLSITDATEQGQGKAIVHWVWMSLLDIAHRENRSGSKSMLIQEIEKKGEGLGFVSSLNSSR